MYGLQLLRLGKLELFLGREEEARRHISSAVKIIAVSHGPSHPFYVQEVLPLVQQVMCSLKD
jgi:hypothetical protein